MTGPGSPLSNADSMNEIRDVIIENFDTGAAGSILISAGKTRVLCTASLSTDLPGWLASKEPPSGWISSEYNMLPGSTSPRKRRGTDGRSTEIQRLIGRSLRAMVELTSIPGLSIICDCEVLQADGGTRTASITGASVSLMIALGAALDDGRLAAPPTDRLPVELVTAISAGVVDGKCVVDLDYEKDSRADVDLNAVQNQKKEWIELQGTGERAGFSKAQLDEILDLCDAAIDKIRNRQLEFLKKNLSANATRILLGA
ncbi:MAG: ribonuclease PH [Spirochaetaceae bacterium]|nr:ribonuclease PH [Spirochaetaceae bacterium]